MQNQNILRDIRIYNLFPRLYGGVQDWLKAARHARDMGFDTLYLNPVHETGRSGSIYAIRDYEAYDEVVFPGLSREEAEHQIIQFLQECRNMGLRVLCDLVINHTAVDSVLTVFPEWYERKSDGHLRCAGTFTLNGDYVEWTDCAKLDYRHPKSELWEYMVKLCRRYMKMGFSGFRCDVAAHIPARFWKYLIDTLKQDYPDVMFLGEAFLASAGEIYSLAQAGFQYLFNSARWWDYAEDWLIDQNNRYKDIIGSISFPENHDTTRLMAAEKGNPARARQRLKLTGLLSAGWMITGGCEYGFIKPLHVSETRKSDWEDIQTDLTPDIRTIMKLRDEYPVFRMDGELKILPSPDDRVTILSKKADGQQALLLLNRSCEEIPLNLESLAAEFPYHVLPSQVVLTPYEIVHYVDALANTEQMPVNISWCLDSQGTIALKSIPMKPLRTGESLVQILACGICGSDYHEIHQGRSFWRRPDEGGHEWVGRVVSLLPPEHGLEPGDRVAFCMPRQGTGMLQGGGFSRYAVVRNDCLVALMPEDDTLLCTMIEPLAVAVHAVQLLNDAETIAVIGSGTLALLTERLLSILRPSCQTTLFYKHEEILRHTQKNTRCLAFPPAGQNETWDAVLECSGAEESISAFLPVLRQKGQMLLLGLYRAALSVNMTDIMFRELQIQGSFLYTKEDFRKAAELIRSNILRTDDLIQVYPFEKAREALNLSSDRRLKVLLRQDES